MTSKEVRAGENLHPEGLTSIQERLVEALFTTKTLGKVKKRYLDGNGGFRFEEMTREMGVIDFSQDPEHEFAITVHTKTPEAALSPFFINLRNLDSNVLGQIGEVMHEMAPYFESHGHVPGPDIVAGVPKAGVPLAEAYSKVSRIPAEDIFGKEETATTKKIVGLGKDGKGIEVRLIDDLASQGITKVQAVEAAEEMGYRVASFYVLIDREQGGLDILKKHVPDVRAAMTITQIFDFALRRGFIQKEMHEKCLGYVRDSAKIV